MVGATILMIIIMSFVLIKSADLVIVALRRISRETHTKLFTLAALVLAISTSFPELFVGITSALEGDSILSLGDITGSNIANLSFVVGLTALIAGRVRVHPEFLKKDVVIAFFAGILPILLLLDNKLGRVDGLILLAIYAAYATSFFRVRYKQIAKEQVEEESFFYRFLRKFNHMGARKRREIGKLFVGIAIMLFSADVIVKLAVHLASLAGIPKLVVGLVVIAIGTSLPEFAFSLESVEDHEPSMFFGNVLGSTIANSTLVIGLVSVIRPIEVHAISEYFKAAAAFIIIYLTFWFFIRSKHRLDRWEAGVLLIIYIIFVISEVVAL
ncbi:MAG: calcium/sodium antiporter [Candidatus Woesebacteria bacterium]|jgi:cation:H+ antiporter